MCSNGRFSGVGTSGCQGAGHVDHPEGWPDAIIGTSTIKCGCGAESVLGTAEPVLGYFFFLNSVPGYFPDPGQQNLASELTWKLERRGWMDMLVSWNLDCLG